MTTVDKGDELVDRGADRLQELADKAGSGDGVTQRLAQPLADDAAFVRKLKPSLIAERLRGEAPTDRPPASGTFAASTPRADGRPAGGERGPNPFLVLAAAFAVGVLLARIVDWRSHAHPRD
jgi:hypothetical protein